MTDDELLDEFLRAYPDPDDQDRLLAAFRRDLRERGLWEDDA